MGQVYAIALEEMIRLKRQLPGEMRHAVPLHYFENIFPERHTYV